jgi:isopenicillin-N N-acyltransferase-like protein
MAIPHFLVTGNARQRGQAQGESFKQRIHETVDFYESQLFRNANLSPERVRESAEIVKRLIGDFSRDFTDEIEAIAEASDLESWRLFALNARTEILNTRVGECTSAVFRDSALIGQTWDWLEQLEDLAVLVEHHYSDGLKLITLTEPGILAKVGLNNRGLGLCLNFLSSRHALSGLPVHIVCRAIMEAIDVGHAREKIADSRTGKSSHFLVADRSGDALSMEFAGENHTEINLQNGNYLHTNHCINNTFSSDAIPGSEDRLAQGYKELESRPTHDLETMKRLLLHNEGEEYAIQSNYKAEAMFGGLKVGTCATVICDLKTSTLHIKKGPGGAANFQTLRMS